MVNIKREKKKRNKKILIKNIQNLQNTISNRKMYIAVKR